MQARIKNNIVVEVSENPNSQFHPDVAQQFEPVPDEVDAGMTRHEDGTFSFVEVERPPIVEIKPVNSSQIRQWMTADERVSLAGSVDPYVVDVRLQLVSPGYLLHSSEFDQAVDYLVSADVLTAARGAELKDLY